MNKIYKLIFALFVLPFITGCNSWLDVDSDTNVLEKDLFKTGEGFRSSLNGIYTLLGGNNLYGGELTYGLSSIATKIYDEKSLTEGIGSTNKYTEFLRGNPENEELKMVTSSIWADTYRAIANCNNLIKYTEKASSDIFEQGELERKLILGESIAVRALLHFEIFRLFGYMPNEAGAGEKRIPYVTKFPIKQPTYNNSTEILDYIIKDLREARTILKEIDIDKNLVNLNSTYLFWLRYKEELFMGYRGSRMNYLAVSILLSRAYLYKGDYDQAETIATEIYAYGPDGGMEDSIIEFSDTKKIKLKFRSDLIFGAINRQLYKNYNSATTQNNWKLSNPAAIFGEDINDDIRFLNLIKDNKSTRWNNLPFSPLDEDAEVDGTIAPVIRFSEVYHILAECKAQKGDIEGSLAILSQLRKARGQFKTVITLDQEKIDEIMEEMSWMGATSFEDLLDQLAQPEYGLTGADVLEADYGYPESSYKKTVSGNYMPPLTITTKEEMLNAIYNDYHRESMDEGRSYWLYKRIGKGLDICSTFSLPRIEIEYTAL